MDRWGVIGFALVIIAIRTGSQSIGKTPKLAVVGDNVPLECTGADDKREVNWTSPNGDKLTHGEKVLTLDNRFEVLHKLRWYLRIKNVSVSDSGDYVCVSNGDHQHVVELTVNESVTDNLVSTTQSTTTTQSPSTTQSPTTTESLTTDPSKCSDTRPCNNSGSCENGSCICHSNFTGSFCELSTECDVGYCQINNTANCTKELINGEYVNQCKCLPFYKGPKCEIHDHCKRVPCENRGICTLNYPEEGYECDCKLVGDPNNDCKLNTFDECSRQPPFSTKSYITCVDLIESRRMYCSPGYSGYACRDIVDVGLFCDRNGPGSCSNEGYCKPFCNVDICNGTDNCKFTADPFNTDGFKNNTDCIRSFGDGYTDHACNSEETLFDGFDAVMNVKTDCSPFFNTTCTIDFGNEDCKLGCDTEECLWDGYDCDNDERRPENSLTGVVVVELKGNLEHPIEEIQKNISLMLRSMVNLTVEDNINSTDTILSFKIREGVFTNVEYAGKFMAAAVAKRPGWLDRVKIKDIYVCPAGMYGEKCKNNCSTCQKGDDICKWQDGECLNGCPTAHRGQFCEPCDMCKDEGEVCDPMTGECLHGCNRGYWGNNCSPCRMSCKQEGDVCNNATGECLHGCISNEFYTSWCKQCPQNCTGGCDDKGHCNACSVGTYGETCSNSCDKYCQNETCDHVTGLCDCRSNYFLSLTDKMCNRCGDGCRDICDGTSGNCRCKDGFYGEKCNLICNEKCEDKVCHVNGTCMKGCKPGHYGLTCAKNCPIGCSACARNDGICEGNCKPGYEGSTCEKSPHTGDNDETTDNTGIIIGVIISLLLIILIIAVACCYWKKRQSGDYVMEDEEMEDPTQKDPNTLSVHTNSHMQPSSPLLGHSMDMIELDEKQNFAVYAGPGRGQTEESTPNGNGPDLNNPENNGANEADDSENDTADGKVDDTAGKNERCTSSVVMEIGKGGRVLSVSDGDEAQSPTFTKEVNVAIGEENESHDDDSAFADPPHSPLGAVRAPLASEENILASLGPKEMEDDPADRPGGFDDEGKDRESNKSRSSSSSSSTSKSSKSSKEEVTEM